jgi:hypothetical protein
MEPLAVEFEEKQYGRDGAAVSWGLYCVRTTYPNTLATPFSGLRRTKLCRRCKTVAACNQARGCWPSEAWRCFVCCGRES